MEGVSVVADTPRGSAANRWPILIMVGFVILIGTCIMSRYIQPAWTGALVGLIVVIGTGFVFAAGWLAGEENR